MRVQQCAGGLAGRFFRALRLGQFCWFIQVLLVFLNDQIGDSMAFLGLCEFCTDTISDIRNLWFVQGDSLSSFKVVF